MTILFNNKKNNQNNKKKINKLTIMLKIKLINKNNLSNKKIIFQVKQMMINKNKKILTIKLMKIMKTAIMFYLVRIKINKIVSYRKIAI